MDLREFAPLLCLKKMSELVGFFKFQAYHNHRESNALSLKQNQVKHTLLLFIRSFIIIILNKINK